MTITPEGYDLESNPPKGWEQVGTTYGAGTPKQFTEVSHWLHTETALIVQRFGIDFIIRLPNDGYAVNKAAKMRRFGTPQAAARAAQQLNTTTETDQ